MSKMRKMGNEGKYSSYSLWINISEKESYESTSNRSAQKPFPRGIEWSNS